jgi:DNA mismatch endonuclease (patch repair protein)
MSIIDRKEKNEIENTDVFSPEKRSEVMSKIGSKNSRPELLVRSALHKLGYRFRLHSKDLPGKPDIVLPKYRTAIFIHGCFWHQHESCRYGHLPRSNLEYWGPKLKRNKERDVKNQAELKKLGWKVLVIWECQISKNLIKAVQEIHKILAEIPAGKRLTEND